MYKQFATRFPEARFLRVNGNENADMVHLGRDRLGVRSSPSFYIFRNGEQVHHHTGAKEEKFEEVRKRGDPRGWRRVAALC